MAFFLCLVLSDLLCCQVLSIIKQDIRELTSSVLTLARGMCLVVQVHSHALFFVDLKMSMYHHHRKNYTAVIDFVDPVSAYSVWLLIVATYLVCFPFTDEIF